MRQIVAEMGDLWKLATQDAVMGYNNSRFQTDTDYHRKD